jgi:hypothetical protein
MTRTVISLRVLTLGYAHPVCLLILFINSVVLSLRNSSEATRRDSLSRHAEGRPPANLKEAEGSEIGDAVPPLGRTCSWAMRSSYSCSGFSLYKGVYEPAGRPGHLDQADPHHDVQALVGLGERADQLLQPVERKAIK